MHRLMCLCFFDVAMCCVCDLLCAAVWNCFCFCVRGLVGSMCLCVLFVNYCVLFYGMFCSCCLLMWYVFACVACGVLCDVVWIVLLFLFVWVFC